jgi:1,4-dihydroxy-2-naphthoate octaprenyltransferase
MVVFLGKGFKQSNMPFQCIIIVAYGNKVVVVGCAKLATPYMSMLCCLPFKTLNVKSKFNYKVGNSTVVVLRLEKTMLMMSITSLSHVDSG